MPEEPPPIFVRDIGSFHVGGHVTRLDGLPARDRVSTNSGPVHPIDPNGEIVVGQMYVQYTRLADPRAVAPLLLWHGGGMSGATWETTPDGRPGWQMFFLRAGFDTYVSGRRRAWTCLLGALSAGLPGSALFPHGQGGMGGDVPLRTGRIVARRPGAAANPSRAAVRNRRVQRLSRSVRPALELQQRSDPARLRRLAAAHGRGARSSSHTAREAISGSPPRCTPPSEYVPWSRSSPPARRIRRCGMRAACGMSRIYSSGAISSIGIRSGSSPARPWNDGATH